MRHPELVLKHERGSLVERESTESPVDPLRFDEAGRRIGGLVVDEVDERDLRASSGPTTFVIASVDDHPAQPRLEPFRVAESRQLAPRSDDRLLGGVLRSVGVAEYQARERVHAIRRSIDERGECVVVTPHRPFDLLDAHRVPGSLLAARIDDARSDGDDPIESGTSATDASDLTSAGGTAAHVPGMGRGGEAAAAIGPLADANRPWPPSLGPDDRVGAFSPAGRRCRQPATDSRIDRASAYVGSRGELRIAASSRVSVTSWSMAASSARPR